MLDGKFLCNATLRERVAMHIPKGWSDKLQLANMDTFIKLKPSYVGGLGWY